MPNLSNFSSIWNNIKEMDLRPLCQDALRIVKIALVGAPDTGCATLADQMRSDPARPGTETQTPILILTPGEAQPAAEANLIVLLLNPQAADFSQEKALVRSWVAADKKVVVLVNHAVVANETPARGPWVDWGQRSVLYGAADDSAFSTREFVPAVMDLIPEHLSPLARAFPLFRVPIARHMINDASFSNATYSLSTGLAEVVPIFDIPLNVADMVVLTKTQAFLVYKLGLALGLSTRWQDYVAEFSSVLGGGFLWRQVARGLIGLIPAWGIVPKVAVAYSGTYVVGSVVLQWYLTGRHVTRQQMSELYKQSFQRGRVFAQTLASKMPRPRLRLPKIQFQLHLPRLPFRWGRSKAQVLPAAASQICADCGRANAADGRFCQYCGMPLSRPIPPVELPAGGNMTPSAAEDTKRPAG